jgi:hypothetical protein
VRLPAGKKRKRTSRKKLCFLSILRPALRERNGKSENRLWCGGPGVAMVLTLVGKRGFKKAGSPDHSN